MTIDACTVVAVLAVFCRMQFEDLLCVLSIVISCGSVAGQLLPGEQVTIFGRDVRMRRRSKRFIFFCGGIVVLTVRL